MIRELDTFVVGHVKGLLHEHHLLAVLLARFVLILFQDSFELSILHSTLYFILLVSAIVLRSLVVFLLAICLLDLFIVWTTIRYVAFQVSFPVLLLLEFELSRLL